MTKLKNAMHRIIKRKRNYFLGRLEVDYERRKQEDVTGGHLIPRLSDPKIIYKNVEINMSLSRLEEANTLIIALKHLVGIPHSRSNKTMFPVPKVLVDTIQLKCNNLPTERVELPSLVEQAS